MNIKNSLSQVDLFNGLSSGQLDDVARIVTLREYNKGEIVFLDGDAAVGFYMVAAGRVKVYKVSPDGKEQIMHIFGTGQPFAEVPVFAGSHYPANAEAMDPSALFFFPKKEFIRLIHDLGFDRQLMIAPSWHGNMSESWHLEGVFRAYFRHFLVANWWFRK